ncbi:MAG: TlpA disulfide reductase family protein [Syntrophales bacterium]
MADKKASPGGGRNVKAVVFIVFMIVAVAAVILLQGKDGLFKPRQQPRVAEGAPAPAFIFPGLDGRMVDLKAYRGKVVFLNIWATWCPPCRDEMPSMERLYRELKGEDFEILAVSVDAAGAAAVAPFVKKYQLSFPALLDPKGTTQDLYGTTGVPESFIINRDGVVEKIVIGPMDWATPEVVRYFRELIQGR